MSNGVHAIVIFYDGKDPVDTDIALISKVVDERLGTVGDEQILVYTTEDLSRMALTGPQKPVVIAKPAEVIEPERTPEDYAIIYIGEVLKPYLKDYNYEQFVPMLTRRIVAAQQNTTEDDKKFLNALEILSKDTLKVSKSLMQEYYFTARILNVIKNIYNWL